jgi:hypothetical protein
MGGLSMYHKPLFKHRIHAESATTEGLKANVRQREDFDIFCRIWPKFIAGILSKFYAGSYKSNNSITGNERKTTNHIEIYDPAWCGSCLIIICIE